MQSGEVHRVDLEKLLKRKDNSGKAVINTNTLSKTHFYSKFPDSLAMDWKYQLIGDEIITSVGTVHSSTDSKDKAMDIVGKFNSSKFNKEAGRYKWNPDSLNELVKEIRKHIPDFLKSTIPRPFALDPLDKVAVGRIQGTKQSVDLDKELDNLFK